MPSCNRFKYSNLALSDDAVPETFHDDQVESLLGKEELSGRQKYDWSQLKKTTLRVCGLVVILSCILMFVVGLRWQLNANQYCLELHSFYGRRLRKFHS